MMPALLRSAWITRFTVVRTSAHPAIAPRRCDATAVPPPTVASRPSSTSADAAARATAKYVATSVAR